MNKRIWLLTAAAVCALGLSACGAGKSGLQQGASAGVEQSGAVSPSPSPSPALTEIRIYDGDANIENLVERTVRVPAGSSADLVKAGLAAMSQKPEGGGIALAAALEVRSIELTGGVLKLDVALKSEGRLGSGGELLLTSALQKLFFQFSDIDKVELTVGGQQVDSLMGHVELPFPIVREQ